MLQYLYTRIWHASFVFLFAAFFKIYSGKYRVSILFTLHFYWLQYRDQGLKLFTFKFYSYDIIKGQFLISKALSSICFVLSLINQIYTVLVASASLFVFSKVG